jgi:hypothetical protein
MCVFSKFSLDMIGAFTSERKLTVYYLKLACHSSLLPLGENSRSTADETNRLSLLGFGRPGSGDKKKEGKERKRALSKSRADYLGATKLHQLAGSLCGWQLQLYPRRPAAHPEGFDLCYKRQGERVDYFCSAALATVLLRCRRRRSNIRISAVRK